MVVPGQVGAGSAGVECRLGTTACRPGQTLPSGSVREQRGNDRGQGRGVVGGH